MKSDKNTRAKYFLLYARVMIEVSVDQDFPSSILFQDKLGNTQRCGIEYDWIPITCKSCNGLGHQTDSWRKGKEKAREEWRPKAIQPVRVVQPRVAVPPPIPSSVVLSVIHVVSTPASTMAVLNVQGRSTTMYRPGNSSFLETLNRSLIGDARARDAIGSVPTHTGHG